jgi:hypothetical protein
MATKGEPAEQRKRHDDLEHYRKPHQRHAELSSCQGSGSDDRTKAVKEG